MAISGNTLHAGRFEHFLTIMRSPEGASFRRRAAKYHHAITRRGVVSPASSQHTIMRSPEGVNTHAITRRGFAISGNTLVLSSFLPSCDHPKGRRFRRAAKVPSCDHPKRPGCKSVYQCEHQKGRPFALMIVVVITLRGVVSARSHVYQ